MAGLRLCSVLFLQVSSVAVISTTGAVVQEQECSAANAACKDDLVRWTDDAEQVSRVEFRKKESDPLSNRIRSRIEALVADAQASASLLREAVTGSAEAVQVLVERSDAAKCGFG